MISHLNYFILIFSFGIVVNSCTGNQTGNNSGAENKKLSQPVREISYRITTPSDNQTFVIGKKINVSLEAADTSGIDSLKLILEDYSVSLQPEKNLKADLETEGMKTGHARIKLRVFLHGGLTQDASVPVIFLSDVKPQSYGYRVLNVFPHSRNNYTQGLEYLNGHFYEGTGQYGKSSLQKIIYNTGEVVKLKTLDSDIFGEGITILNGKIFQITYQNKVGFVYDVESFDQIRKIYYQNQEGWGLTNNGKEVLMSDGTNIIYFMDPEYFSVIRKIEVYDDTQAVDKLNELEYIDGKIYANRYMTDQIVIIDPESGKITGSADMNGLLKEEERQPSTDVLNGIAWDPGKKRLFVTGKNWPGIFHVELIPR